MSLAAPVLLLSLPVTLCLPSLFRMSLDEFVAALGELAVMKYGAGLSASDAFKELFVRVRSSRRRPLCDVHCCLVCCNCVCVELRHPCACLQHILPLKERFASLPASSSAVAAMSRSDGDGFLDRLCQPEVVRP